MMNKQQNEQKRLEIDRLEKQELENCENCEKKCDEDYEKLRSILKGKGGSNCCLKL